MGLAQDLPSRIHFWRGSSGHRHRCTVYGLYECPPLPNAVYLLVHRTPDGRRDVLRVGQVEEDFPTLNLARLRRVSAALGANEVHVAIVGGNVAGRLALAEDLDGAAAVAPAHRSERRAPLATLM